MLIAALKPAIDHKEGIINKYLGNVFLASIKKPKV